jgi:hypothetical protein
MFVMSDHAINSSDIVLPNFFHLCSEETPLLPFGRVFFGQNELWVSESSIVLGYLLTCFYCLKSFSQSETVEKTILNISSELALNLPIAFLHFII